MGGGIGHAEYDERMNNALAGWILKQVLGRPKLIIAIVVVCIIAGYVFTQNETKTKENLELATKYYNANDYANAFPLYKQYVYREKEKASGTTFYRFAYSWEKIEPKKETSYAPFYSVSAYRFEQDNDIKNKYYSYVIAKEKALGRSHKDFDDERVREVISTLSTRGM